MDVHWFHDIRSMREVQYKYLFNLFSTPSPNFTQKHCFFNGPNKQIPENMNPHVLVSVNFYRISGVPFFFLVTREAKKQGKRKQKKLTARPTQAYQTHTANFWVPLHEDYIYIYMLYLSKQWPHYSSLLFQLLETVYTV